MQDLKTSFETYDLKYLKEQVTRFRNKSNFTFEKEYYIPVEIRKTYNNKNLILFDSGMNDLNIIIVFCTISELIHHFNLEVWIVDGTFKVVCKQFCQLVTIQARIRGKFYPLVYYLMKKKNKNSNLLFLNAIKENSLI